MMRAKIFIDRPSKQLKESLWLWVAHALTGVFVGTLTFLLALCEEKSVEYRKDTLQMLIDDHNDRMGYSYVFYTSFGVICVFVATMITLYIGPGATGSGTAEVMGVLNGINYPKVIGFRTLLVKIFGTTLAVVGGLCIGKEGPLAHIGAITGVMVTYLPFKSFRVLQNDVIRRQIIAAGSSVGVSCAFGAPIGGALFSYEISKPNTFWTFSMLWRVFFATSLGTFTLSIMQSLQQGRPLSVTDAGALKFGQLATTTNTMFDLPSAVIIGVICGLLGSLFIHVNVTMGYLRKRIINTNTKKIAEAVAFAFLTSSAFYLAVYLRKDTCYQRPNLIHANEE
jgi:H+/Cl- antiporter ClcA